VIFGHSVATAFTDIDLAGLISSQGFRITGAAVGNAWGASVSCAGDFNGDGYSDVVIGSYANKVYIWFGHYALNTFATVDLATSTTGSEGFVVSGSDDFGVSVSGGADVNGDGVDDIVIAASTYPSTGAAYVLYSQSAKAVLIWDLAKDGNTTALGQALLGASEADLSFEQVCEVIEVCQVTRITYFITVRACGLGSRRLCPVQPANDRGQIRPGRSSGDVNRVGN
jgi:hypothetical protein